MSTETTTIEAEETELTKRELARLGTLEVSVTKGLASFFEVGAALKEIRDSRLYRESHDTFEDYCQERWGIDKTYAHRNICAAELRSELVPIGTILPANEAQCRPLTKLSDTDRQTAWQEVIERAPETEDGTKLITAKLVEEVVKEYRGTNVPVELESSMHDELEHDRLAPDSKEFRDFLKFADGQPKMTLKDVRTGLGVSDMAARRLVFAATVHPAVDVVTNGRGPGKAFVVDWKEQSASERLNAVNNAPQPKRLDEKLEQVIDSAIAVIDGFYHANGNRLSQTQPKDPERLSVRANTLLAKAEAFVTDINTQVLTKE